MLGLDDAAVHLLQRLRHGFEQRARRLGVVAVALSASVFCCFATSSSARLMCRSASAISSRFVSLSKSSPMASQWGATAFVPRAVAGGTFRRAAR
jgi:hypothetical protein